MRIEFNEKEHIYYVDGEMARISITALLRKHGLAPDYSGVSAKVLESKADIGTYVHKDLENILKDMNKGEYDPLTKQGLQYREYIKENFAQGNAEQVLAYIYKDMIIAGTADVMAIDKNGDYILGDHKNTSAFHREYVSWQVSLLDYFARKLNGQKINGQLLVWPGAKFFKCFYYDTKKDGELKVYELNKVPDVEIEKLLLCEYNGEIYKKPELVINDKEQLEMAMLDAEKYLIEKEAEYKKAKENAESLRDRMLNLMQEQGIKSFESERLKITLVESSERTTIDSTKLKAEYPEIYAKCTKTSITKASVRIKVKDEQ